jgi:GTP-binding protein
VMLAKTDGARIETKITHLYGFEGLHRVPIEEAVAGDIVALAGIDGIFIGDTVTSLEDPRPLPPLRIDEPTLEMLFQVNTSTFAGQDGKYLTSRHLRERLQQELRTNPALRVEDGATPDTFRVYGRGELQLAILIEMMRREGYEVCVGKPRVIFRREADRLMEPYEHLLVDCPEEYIGVITGTLGTRRGVMARLSNHGTGWVRMEFEIPMRGLIGLRPLLMTATRGTAILNSEFAGYREAEGEISHRSTGVLIADRAGRVTSYALNSLQDRGELLVIAGTPVYEGMIVGENSRENDLVVNITKEKKLTNMRAAGSDDNYQIAPARILSLEEAIAFISDDELVEVTPKNLRLRKSILGVEDRKKAERRESIV